MTSLHARLRRSALILTGSILAAVVAFGTGSAAFAADASGTPDSTPAAAAAASSSGTHGLNYVALGDSYSAGFGLTPYSDKPAIGCYQAEQNFPHRVAASLGLNLTDVTCSGAVTANIIDTPQSTAPGVFAPVQSDALSASTDIVTVTIGGNDFGFAPVAASCIAYSAVGPTVTSYDSCKAFYDFYGKDYLESTIPGVATAVRHAFDVIHQKAPNAKIFVIAYPAIGPDAAHTPAGGCFTSLIGTGQPVFTQNAYPFTDVDVPYLNALESQLDEAIQTQATAVGATFIPLFDQTLGNSPCASSPVSYLNGITIQDDPNAPSVPAIGPDGHQLTGPGGVAISLKLGALHPNEAGVGFVEKNVQAAISAAFPTKPDNGGSDTQPVGTVTGPVVTTATAPVLAESGSDTVPASFGGALVLLVGACLLAAASVRRRRTEKRASVVE